MHVTDTGNTTSVNNTPMSAATSVSLGLDAKESCRYGFTDIVRKASLLERSLACQESWVSPRSVKTTSRRGIPEAVMSLRILSTFEPRFT